MGPVPGPRGGYYPEDTLRTFVVSGTSVHLLFRTRALRVYRCGSFEVHEMVAVGIERHLNRHTSWIFEWRACSALSPGMP